MSLNALPSSERPHISFFGKRNAGKSSVVNAVTGQNLSIVSDQLGTTTDPVMKAMEILPLGPVVIIDTPGFDDEGTLGELRVEKAREILKRTDIAVLVVDGTVGMSECDQELIALFKEFEIFYFIAYNKADLLPEESVKLLKTGEKISSGVEMYLSALSGIGIYELKEALGHVIDSSAAPEYIIRNLIQPKDLVVLVIPIDEAAPKGRIILPQQLTLRECLDANAEVVCVQDTELKDLLSSLKKKPAMVITDSQAFQQVAEDTPEEILLTSFSILMARYKGFLESAIHGIAALKNLKAGAKILIAEGCTHHRQCNDIGTVKLPKMLRKFVGAEISVETCSGHEFPTDLEKYDLVLHCGGCMISEKEVLNRVKQAERQGIPFTNYGTAIAFFNGILPRSLELFPELLKLIQ